MSKKNIALLASIVVIGLLLRVYHIGSVPPGYTDDELGYIYNAYSITKTGKNLLGEKIPFLTWHYGRGFPFMPTTIYLFSFFYTFISPTAETARLPSIFLGTLDIALIYLLVQYLFRKNVISLIASSVLAFSPWHIFLSRTALDTNISLFFYLFGLSVYFWEVKRGKLPFISFAMFFLGMLAYRGMIPVLFLLLITLYFYSSYKQLLRKKQKIFYIAGTILIISIFILISIMYVNKGFLSEASINTNNLQNDIDIYIRESKGPLSLRRVVFNKPVVVVLTYLRNYMKGYEFEHMFFTGEYGNIVTIADQGKLYILDIIMLFMGLYYLFKVDKKKQGFLVLSLILIGGVPGMIAGPVYIARNYFSVIGLSISIGLGVYFTFTVLKKIRYGYLAIGFLIAVYAYLIIRFLFFYHYRFAYHNSESWYKSMKEVSQTIQAEKNNYDYVIIVPGSWQQLVQYAFYSHISPGNIQESRYKQYNGRILYKNVVFEPSCENKRIPFIDERVNEKQNKYLLILSDNNCMTSAPTKKVIRDYFGNTIFRIVSYSRYE